jgi:ABC-type lipoprotein release transport system permease subunit
VLLFLLQDAFAGEVLLLTMPQMWEIMVCGIVFVGVVLASLWPAMRAARIHVDEVLGRL